MGGRGPSPLIPFLLVGVLGFVIFGSTMMSIFESISSAYEALAEASGTFSLLLLLLLFFVLFLILLSTFFPTPRFASSPGYRHMSSGYGSDFDGFGLGWLLMVVLFFVLYATV